MDGGYNATALGYGIHTQGDSLEELPTMVKDAVGCYFDDAQDAPQLIRLQSVRDEVLARQPFTPPARPVALATAAAPGRAH